MTPAQLSELLALLLRIAVAMEAQVAATEAHTNALQGVNFAIQDAAGCLQ